MIYFILSLLPSFLNVPIRRMLGAKIGKGSKIKWGTLLRVGNKSLVIGDNTVIGPFSYVSASEFKVGNHVVIKPLAIISTRVVEFADYVHIAPVALIRSSFTKHSKIVMGKHSRVFPFCWLDTGEGIYIGDNVGLGGHTLIFTHGSWPDYLDGGPVSFGAVTIESNVWIPWRVFILPGVTIGENSVIGANSTVNKSLPARVLAAGSPAKILKEDLPVGINDDEKNKRALFVVNDYAEYLQFKNNANFSINGNTFDFGTYSIIIDNKNEAKAGDLLILTHDNISSNEVKQFIDNKISVINHVDKTYFRGGGDKTFDDFVFYIRKFGIRLDYK